MSTQGHNDSRPTTSNLHIRREPLDGGEQRLRLNADKTVLLGAGSKSDSVSLTGSGPPLRLGECDETITASDHVRLLGVTISSDLSIDKHVSNTSSSCFYWLHQLRRIRRSLDTTSAKTLVHAFVSSRVDCCNAVLAGSSNATADRLQRVLNAAARGVSGTHKFDRGLTHLLHSDLHWPDIPRRIQFKLGVTVHRCLQSNAPQYLVDCCKSSSLRLMLPVASGSAPHVVISSSCHYITAPSSAVGRFLLRARQPGTRCQTISVTRRLAKTLSATSNFSEAALRHLYFFSRGEFRFG